MRSAISVSLKVAIVYVHERASIPADQVAEESSKSMVENVFTPLAQQVFYPARIWANAPIQTLG